MNPDWLVRNLLCIQNKSALSLGSVTIAIRLLGNNSFELVVWKILFRVYRHGFRYRCSRISTSFGRLFLDPRMANVNGLCFNSRWVDGNGLCEVDRIDCARTRSKLKCFARSVLYFLTLFFLNRPISLFFYRFHPTLPKDFCQHLRLFLQPR